MANLLRILSYLRKYTLYSAMNVLFNILTVVFSLFSVVMIIPFLQLLLKKIPLVMQAPPFKWDANYFFEYLKFLLSKQIAASGPDGSIIVLAKFCALIAVLFFFKNLFRFLALFFLSPIRSGVVRDIRNDLFNKILSLPLSYYSKGKKGDIIARVTDDVREIENSIISFIEVTVREPLTIIIFLVALLFMSPQLTGFVLLMLLITGFIIGRVSKSFEAPISRSPNRNRAVDFAD